MQCFVQRVYCHVKCWKLNTGTIGRRMHYVVKFIEGCACELTCKRTHFPLYGRLSVLCKYNNYKVCIIELYIIHTSDVLML